MTESAATITIDLPAIALEQAVYTRWLLFCRRYRISGRVVCRHWRWDGHVFRVCDDPVPGAKVEIYDVDCFWWFCKKDLIKTVTTDPDGTFEAEFWWCCPPLFPWFPHRWVIDPDLLELIRHLVEQVKPRLPIPLPDPPPDPLELEPYLHSLGAALQIGTVPAAMQMTAGSTPVDQAALVGLLPRAPELEQLHVWPWWPRRDCQPDLLFRATQECEGAVQVIYEEKLFQTRWNTPADLDVTLFANDKACCIPVCEDPPCGDCFKWAEARCTPVKNIGGNDPLSPVAADLQGIASPGSADIVFARTIPLTGVFGSLADVDCYEIEYSLNGSAFAPLPPNTLGGFNRIFWGPPCGGGAPQWNTAPFPATVRQDAANVDHHVYESRQHYEQNCDPASWGLTRFWTSNRDMTIVWVTASLTSTSEAPLISDGLYELRVVGYKLDAAGKLINRQVMKRCDTDDEERLIIRLDNRTVPNHPASTGTHPWGPGYVHVGTLDPDCDFVKFVKNEGKGEEEEVDACDIVELKKNDTLTVHFSVTVPAAGADRHLGGYWMTVHHAESAYFNAITASGGVQADPTAIVGPTYADAVSQGAARPWWGGGSYKLVLDGTDFPETCAYLFRLHAYKRTFDGCGPIEWFHHNNAEFSLTIKKIGA